MLVNKKIEEAFTIDSSFYTSSSIFSASKKIFENSWQFITHENILSNKNVFPFSLLDEYINEPLILLKNNNGELNCLSNVCTHRGNILVEKHCQLKDNILCRYHGRRFWRCLLM